MVSNLANINQLFTRMQAAGFDTTSPLKWCFYFTGTDKEKLRLVYEELKANDHALESVEKAENSEQWTLFTSTHEALTSEELHERNEVFNALAASYGVESYDGWRVEKTTLF
ncbi:ribonuclease E inhibitor RraB [Hymenobacter terrenus]|uniref:ribonuclease E inhibitor RraB n=1 Tax=Hymenobacter terrenus TaxID=1629124 RepID=UPI0006199D68|nr:ribonuclease E inhibitor RraB [Hymenobacter terrenus]